MTSKALRIPALNSAKKKKSNSSKPIGFWLLNGSVSCELNTENRHKNTYLMPQFSSHEMEMPSLYLAGGHTNSLSKKF